MEKLKSVARTVQIKINDNEIRTFYFCEFCDAEHYSIMKSYLEEKIKNGIEYLKQKYENRRIESR